MIEAHTVSSIGHKGEGDDYRLVILTHFPHNEQPSHPLQLDGMALQKREVGYDMDGFEKAIKSALDYYSAPQKCKITEQRVSAEFLEQESMDMHKGMMGDKLLFFKLPIDCERDTYTVIGINQ